MATISISVVQTVPTFGDLQGNIERATREIGEAARAGAKLVVLHGYALTGLENLQALLDNRLYDAFESQPNKLARALETAGLGDTGVLLVDDRNLSGEELLLIRHGACKPVDYEESDFGLTASVFGIDILLWNMGADDFPGGGEEDAPQFDLLLLNGESRFYAGEEERAERFELLFELAGETGKPVVCASIAGGHDGAVYRGESSLHAPGTGMVRVLQPDRAGHFEFTVPMDASAMTATTTAMAPLVDPTEVLYRHLVTGLRTYLNTAGFERVIIGLSGGIDSAFVAALAADAIGGENIIGVAMPSVYSSDHSLNDAKDIAQRLGAEFRVKPIASVVEAFENTVELTGVAAENLQARVRGTILMSISNQEGALVLATGNKSEAAVGYSTLYGDTVGGYAPIGDVWKTQVWELSRWRNNRAVDSGEIPPIPENSITKPPSAELRPDQRDTDSLPDYDVLDQILELITEPNEGVGEALADGLPVQDIKRAEHLYRISEWKRRQEAQPTVVSGNPLDRLIPMTNAWRRK